MNSWLNEWRAFRSQWAFYRYRLKPKAMRRLLRQFGTLSNNPGQDKIGMMPDLRQIIAELQINGVPLVDQLPA